MRKEYIHNYLESADDFTNEVKVTREDKKDSTLGIRSIFEGIHGSQVFTVCFKKQDTPKSQRKLNAEIATLISDFSKEIDAIQKNKRDGRYNCIDMDIEDTNNVRPVNINTIRWIILGGTKYVVE